MECMKLVSCILFGKVFQHIMYMRPVVADIPHYVPYNSSSGGWVGAGSMALFCRWFESRFPDKHPFPVREDVVYEYFSELRSSQASASRADTFVSTLNFSAEVFGLQGAADAAASIRVKGAALDMFLSKRPRRRAPEIQPIMIAALEIAACVEQDPYLRAIAGFCFMCVFGRMRVSDVNRMVNGSVLGNFLRPLYCGQKLHVARKRKQLVYQWCLRLMDCWE